MGGGTSEENTQQNMATSNNDVDKPPSPSFAVPPLAPLEYLQKQRKGAITEPSLHAAGYNGEQNRKKSYAMDTKRGERRGSTWGKRTETSEFMKVIR